MGDTTAARVRAIAPELTTFINNNTDGVVDIILEDVAGQITSAVYGAKQERAQRYLAAHLMTLANATATSGGGGPVVMEKVGDETVKYGENSFAGADRYDETSYGRVYMAIKRGCIGAFKTITP